MLLIPLNQFGSLFSLTIIFEPGPHKSLDLGTNLEGPTSIPGPFFNCLFPRY